MSLGRPRQGLVNLVSAAPMAGIPITIAGTVRPDDVAVDFQLVSATMTVMIGTDSSVLISVASRASPCPRWYTTA